MRQSLVCPQGHRWQAGESEKCPACGAAAAFVSPGAGSISGRAESASFPQPASRDQPPTISGNTPHSDNGAKDDPDRTLAPELPTGALAVGRTADATFEILGELGRGGMGVVYKARQLRLNRHVALKMILSGSHAGPEQLLRFRAEAEALAPLQHPNIVQIYEVGELDGHPYFSLEYIDGGSLAQKLASTPQPPRQAAQLVETLARAMHFAHLRGIVHRDLKPANILLASGGRKPPDVAETSGGLRSPLTDVVPKITDFGLAKNLDSDNAHTRTGAILGTPSYISPEQASGRKEIGPATDVYALGAILYEMLTGRPPFRGESSMDTMLQVMTEEPVPPKRLQPKVPADLETICLKCLEKDPIKRYTNAEALADDLKRFLAGEPIKARPIGSVARVYKWTRRRPTLAALVFLGMAAASALFFGSLWYNAKLSAANRLEKQRSEDLIVEKGKVEDQRRRAEEERQKAVIAQRREEEQRKDALDRLEHSRRSLYAFQLMHAASLARIDPKQALDLLQDPERCPEGFRDFTWFYLHSLCRRERASIPLPKGTSCFALAADSKTLATGGGDETVLLWDVDKRQSRPLKTGHAGPVVAVAFAPDGQTLATASFDKTIKLFNVETGAELGTLEGHTQGVRTVVFSPDGKWLASGGHDRSVLLWDPVKRELKTTLSGHKGAVGAIAFSPDSQTLGSASADRTVRLWDVSAGKELGGPLEGHTDSVLAVAFAATGKLLASGSADGTVKLWIVGQKTPTETLRGHTAAVQAVAFSPTGRHLASAGADATVKLWDSGTGELRTTLKGHTQGVLALAFSKDGKTLFSVSADQTLKLWEMHPRSEWAGYQLELGTDGTQPPVTAWSKDGDTLAVVSPRDKVVRLYDVAAEKERIFLQGYSFRIDCLALSPDGKTLATASDDNTIRLFDLKSAQQRAVCTKHGDRILCLSFAADSQTLASGSSDQTVKLWDMTGKERGTLPIKEGPIRSLAFSPDGKLLASADDKSVKLWDPAAKMRSPDLAATTPSVLSLAFSPDGRTLATTVRTDGNVCLWDVARRELRVTVRGHAGVIRSLAFSPDGKTLATGHADWHVMLWDAQTGQERGDLIEHTSPIYTVSFNAAREMLFAIGEDGLARRWQSAK